MMLPPRTLSSLRAVSNRFFRICRQSGGPADLFPDVPWRGWLNFSMPRCTISRFWRWRLSSCAGSQFRQWRRGSAGEAIGGGLRWNRIASASEADAGRIAGGTAERGSAHGWRATPRCGRWIRRALVAWGSRTVSIGAKCSGPVPLLTVARLSLTSEPGWAGVRDLSVGTDPTGGSAHLTERFSIVLRPPYVDQEARRC